MDASVNGTRFAPVIASIRYERSHQSGIGVELRARLDVRQLERERQRALYRAASVFLLRLRPLDDAKSYDILRRDIAASAIPREHREAAWSI